MAGAEAKAFGKQNKGANQDECDAAANEKTSHAGMIARSVIEQCHFVKLLN